VPAYFMAIYLFLQLLRLRFEIIFEKLSLQHFINSFDVSEVLGLNCMNIKTVFTSKKVI